MSKWKVLESDRTDSDGILSDEIYDGEWKTKEEAIAYGRSIAVNGDTDIGRLYYPFYVARVVAESAIDSLDGDDLLEGLASQFCDSWQGVEIHAENFLNAYRSESLAELETTLKAAIKSWADKHSVPHEAEYFDSFEKVNEVAE